MKKADKKRFIKQLTGSIALDLISKIDKMPEEWDGIELRQLIADKFKAETHYRMSIDGKRRRDYNNTVIVNNL